VYNYVHLKNKILLHSKESVLINHETVSVLGLSGLPANKHHKSRRAIRRETLKKIYDLSANIKCQAHLVATSFELIF
jgi:hypothetical protein